MTRRLRPFDNPTFRDALAKAKQDAEQTIDTVTRDQVIFRGLAAAARQAAADLVRFSLEQQSVLKPFAESVAERFNEWLMDKAKVGITFSPAQLAWLNLTRDPIATSLTVEPDDFEFAPFSQRGGLGKAHQLFGDQLPALLDELNTALAA
ncbi:MAG: hypothetical protein LBS59_07010 [Puniceicoccales bacterium]|nr:hypothetical protein [Puniceicoccales bacterium]